MVSKTFFKIDATIRKPTQNQIEMIRRRALANVRRGSSKKEFSAKSVESMLRIVSGRYSNLLSALESEHRKVDHRLDAKFAQGIKETKAMLIKIEQDVHRLESMGYDRKTSGIDYENMVLRLRKLTSGKANEKQSTRPVPSPANQQKSPTRRRIS